MAYYALSLLVSFIAIALLLLYRAALPKPIPGIPYVQKNAHSIFGDIPDALKHYRRTGMLSTFCVQRCEQLNSPIFQIFLRPFCKPWVILCDAREAQDVLSRRGREFDRSQFFSDMFRALFPNAQASLPTHDHWRANRKLMADTMSAQFLNNIAAPQVYLKTLDLVELWRHKQRLANGAAFPVEDDLQMCTIDTIWAATFDEEIGACKSQSRHLAGIDSLAQSGAIIEMPHAATPEAFTALRLLFHSLEIPLHSPFGYRHHWLAVNLYPSLRQARAVKDRLVSGNIQAAWKKFSDDHSSSIESTKTIRSAAELVVEREITLARKEGRAPQHDSKSMHDELTIFLGAGFESVGATVAWGLKYLAKYSDVQQKLRDALRNSFSQDATTGQPTAQSIAKDQCSYLDAFMDEVLRHCCIVSGNSRTTTTDTEVLGYFVPKGVDVQLLCIGPSSTSPAMPIDESTRSKTSREFKEDRRRWNQTDLGEFRPERWLVQGEQGPEFDRRAAPMQAFGGGVRGCFGRKLGYVELRNIFTLLVWNFDIRPPPGNGLLDFKGKEVVTNKPQDCNISLGKVVW